MTEPLESPPPRHIPCVGCGYDLRAHTDRPQAPCPECGRVVKDSLPREVAIATPDQLRRLRHVGLLLTAASAASAGCVAGTIVVLSEIGVGGLTPRGTRVVVAGCFLAALGTHAIAGEVMAGVLTEAHGRRVKRSPLEWAAGLGLVLLALGTLMYESSLGPGWAAATVGFGLLTLAAPRFVTFYDELASATFLASTARHAQADGPHHAEPRQETAGIGYAKLLVDGGLTGSVFAYLVGETFHIGWLQTSLVLSLCLLLAWGVLWLITLAVHFSLLAEASDAC